jgi:hypothetical protein
MAKPQRVTYFRVNLEDKPGSLLAIARDLKAKNVGLIGLRGQDVQAGYAEVYLVGRNPEKLRNACKSSNMVFEEGTAFFVKGTDKTGALVKTLEVLAKAAVNIVVSDAMAVSGNYGFFIQVAPADAEKTALALGAK